MEQMVLKLLRKMNLDTDLTPFININLICITDLSVKCKTTQILENNIGENLDDFGFGDCFLDMTPNNS